SGTTNTAASTTRMPSASRKRLSGCMTFSMRDGSVVALSRSLAADTLSAWADRHRRFVGSAGWLVRQSEKQRTASLTAVARPLHFSAKLHRDRPDAAGRRDREE